MRVSVRALSRYFSISPGELCRVATLRPRRVVPDLDDAVGIRIWKRPDQHGVHDRENGDVGANTQRERQRRDRRITRALGERPGGQLQFAERVPQHRRMLRSSDRPVNDLLVPRPVPISGRTSRSDAGRGARRAAPDGETSGLSIGACRRNVVTMRRLGQRDRAFQDSPGVA